MGIDYGNALDWIVNILRKEEISFQATGGLAAKVYGSRRTLFDIDLELDNSNIKKLVPFLKRHIIYGPEKYLDDSFNIFLMTLKYRKELIDLCGSKNQRIYDLKSKKWIKLNVDLTKSEKHRVFNLEIPVVPLEDLIFYKSKIRRKTDLEDISYMKRQKII